MIEETMSTTLEWLINDYLEINPKFTLGDGTKKEILVKGKIVFDFENAQKIFVLEEIE